MLAIYRKSPSLTSLCLAGLLLRLAGIFYGVYHDARHALKYTDIDYLVFSDATSFLLAPSSHTHNHATGPLGRHLPLGSPYTRETYRYTPLLALLLTPNAIHPLWGKLLFALADVALGLLLYKSLHLQRSKHPKLLVSFAWLFNPLPINIATRGSSEALLGVMVLACLYAAQTHRWNLCAILLGLATHFKIYPAIYAVSLVGHLSQFHLRSLFQKRTIVFGLLAFISFSTLTLVMYLM